MERYFQNKTKPTNQKGTSTWIDIFPKKTYRWPTGTWKMLNITHHQGNANQNHLPPVRMAKIKKTRNNKCWWGCGEKGRNPRALLGIQTDVATVENGMEASQKIKNRITIWSSNYSTAGYLPPKNENTNLRRYLHPCVYRSIAYHSQDLEATQVSIYRWMDKKDVIFTQTHTQWNTTQT